ncbi:hypothetical protein BJX61DRAFT_493807 [Aspergillus egyptiacus]|nr:hypothetical protein BJX61DRAFT_493807 [Aspergillus egyptiacus]
MSNASVKDHADTLLNLPDMERNPRLVCFARSTEHGARGCALMFLEYATPKIIFVAHSLGGLVIKQIVWSPTPSLPVR